MASIKDIAIQAGVSTTTVSHVLNKSRYVHPDTVARVLKAVEELNYRPNMVARSLRHGKTHTIGLLVSDVENPFFSEVARAVEACAYERGYSVIFCNSDENLEKETFYVNVLFARQVDGLILSPVPGDHAYLKKYLARDNRIVLVNRYLDGFDCPAVVCDDEEAMYALAIRLLESGRRRLGAIVGLESVTTTANRLTGLKRALAEYGLLSGDVWQYHGDARREGGYQAARELIHLQDPPDAIISFNSMMLDGFLLGLLDLAPHLIKKMEITGFGYSLVARACRPAEYYIRQPSYDVGRQATNLLVDILQGRRAWGPEQVLLRNEIIGHGPAADLAASEMMGPSPGMDGSAGQQPRAARKS